MSDAASVGRVPNTRDTEGPPAGGPRPEVPPYVLMYSIAYVFDPERSNNSTWDPINFNTLMLDVYVGPMSFQYFDAGHGGKTIVVRWTPQKTNICFNQTVSVSAAAYVSLCLCLCISLSTSTAFYVV